MVDNKYALIVPAFISSYPGGERELFEKMNIHMLPWLKSMAGCTSYTQKELDKGLMVVPKDPLLQQLIAYLYSCALGTSLKERKGPPAYIAGYSMGIYAAMYLSGVLSFEGGIQWIITAYNKMKKAVMGSHYALVSVVGLSKADVEKLINEINGELEVINQNNAFSFVIAGQQNEIASFMESSREYGALSVSNIPSGIPYHTAVLSGSVKDLENNFNFDLGKPDVATRLVSSIDQEILDSKGKVKRELLRNLITPLNWHQTMRYMLSKDIHTFFECGVGKDLTKMGRFIEGDFKIIPIYKSKKFI